MRMNLVVAVAILVVSGGAFAEPVTSLNRKPGLWSMTIASDGKKAHGALRQCIDAQTDARMMQMASQSDLHKCKKNELVKDGAGYRLHAECSMSGSTAVSDGVFKGDFDRKYEGEVTTRFSPPLFGREQSKSSIDATWEGPCPSDMKPGDMELPNGMKMSLDQAQQGAKMAAQMMNNPEVAKMMKGAISNPAVQDALKRLGSATGE